MPKRRARSTLRAGPVLAGALVGLAPPASAQSGARPGADVPCGERDAIVAALERRYAEMPVARGIENNGELIQVFVSPRTGTWTILATRTDGVSCVLAVGDHFEARGPAPDPAALEGDRTAPGERPG